VAYHYYLFMVYWITVGIVLTATTTIVVNAQEEDSNLLFIGNSYLASNNLLGMLESMLEESGDFLTSQSAVFEQYVPGGYHFSSHASDAATAGSTLFNFLNGGTQWNWVVLQEQSQMGGSYQEASVSAAVSLDAAFHAASPNAQTVFFMTWGRRNGDPMNTALYPNFEVMNERLETGYRQYVSATPGSVLAPVGLAFEYIYELDQVVFGIADPATEASSLFYNLYSSDGSHPSSHGSYLAACVLYQTLTGLDPSTITYAPPDVAQDAALQGLLQTAASAVVNAETTTLTTLEPTTVAPTTESPTFRPTSRPPTKSPTTTTPSHSPMPSISTRPSVSTMPSNQPTMSQMPSHSLVPSGAPSISQMPSVSTMPSISTLPSRQPSVSPVPSDSMIPSTTTTPNVGPSPSIP